MSWSRCCVRRARYLWVESSNIHRCILISVSSMLSNEIGSNSGCDTASCHSSHAASLVEATQALSERNSTLVSVHILQRQECPRECVFSSVAPVGILCLRVNVNARKDERPNLQPNSPAWRVKTHTRQTGLSSRYLSLPKLLGTSLPALSLVLATLHRIIGRSVAAVAVLH